MAEPNYNKQLKIKIGALKRLKKEYISYEEEIKKQDLKIQNMKNNNADAYDIKKQVSWYFMRCEQVIRWLQGQFVGLFYLIMNVVNILFDKEIFG